MKHSRFIKIMAAAVVLALLILAIPVTPALGATGVIDITSPATNTGPPATTVTLSCTGFTGGETYTVRFGTTSVITGSTGTGNFTASFAVPSYPRGDYDVTVTTTAPDDSNTEVFTITQDVTATPSPANVGATITVAGSGYAAGISVTIKYDGTSKGTATTNVNGVFTAFTFTLPASVEGTHTIRAEEALYPSTYYDTVSLEVDPDIAINPTTGAVGDTVTVTGDGFDASSTITITFDGVTKTTTTSDANGTLTSTTFVVPTASKGVHIVKAQDIGGNYDTANFTVSASMTIDPTSGPSGITVTVTGTGFAASATVTIKYNNVAVTTSPTTVTSDASGYFTATFTVPTGEAGTYVVQASDGTNTVTANFESTTSATISQTTTETAPGNVGMSLTITGVGFTPNVTVTVTYATDPVTLATATTGTTGNFTVTFTIPASVGGEHTITVSDGTVTREFDFYMEENPPPAPTLTSPATGEKADAEAVFDWSTVQDVTPASNPVTYDLQVATNENFTTASLLVNLTELEDSDYTILPAEKLESTGDDAPYYWRVRAVDAASNASDWSEVETFTVGWSFSFTGWVVWVTIVVVAIVFFFLGLWIGRRSGGGGEYF